MQRARQLSDIRSPKAPAFRLKATFSFIGKNLETARGTYTEIWISGSQWRRETIVNDIHRVEFGTANRIWRLDNSTDFPEVATRLPDLMNVFPQASPTFEFESITDTTDQKVQNSARRLKLAPDKRNTDFVSSRKAECCSRNSHPRYDRRI